MSVIGLNVKKSTHIARLENNAKFEKKLKISMKKRVGKEGKKGRKAVHLDT